MRDTSVTRRGLFTGAAGLLIARALGGCGGPDVSIRIRRVDGTNQGGVILVRASVVLTNHKNEPRMVQVRVALKDAAGTVIASGDETLAVQAAELICHCYSVPVRSAALPPGATLTITYGDESATASLGSIGTAALPSCDYTCNY